MGVVLCVLFLHFISIQGGKVVFVSFLNFCIDHLWLVGMPPKLTKWLSGSGAVFCPGMLWILHLWSDAAFGKFGDKHQGSNDKCKSKHQAEIARLSARSPVKAVEVTASQSTHWHGPKNRIRSKIYHYFLRFQQNDNAIRYTLAYFFPMERVLLNDCPR